MSVDQDSSSVLSGITTTTTSISGTAEELFRIWLSTCFQSEESGCLPAEASRFFYSLANGTEVVTLYDQITLNTKPSYEAALGVLLQTLGPAFAASTPLQPRVRALECLTGALQGCRKSCAATLSTQLVRLLGDFLLQHCGPIAVSEDDLMDDEDEQLRDQAVKGLTVLIGCRMCDEDRDAVLRIRLELAQTGVQRRCAAPDTTHTGYEHPTLFGLSSLPRSRRSLCFELVRAAVDAVGSFHKNDSPNVPEELQQYGSFAAHCLQGETDPRCLLQLLQLLQALLKHWEPLLKDMTSLTENVGDAVAPYYPIQFTPPPVNVHGITRAGLRMALMYILKRDEFWSLGLELVLERLLPPPGDDVATTTDWMECLQDFETLLLNRIDQVSTDQMQKVARALTVVHAQASAQAMSSSAQAQDAAHACRDLVANMALETEATPALWDVLVGQTVSVADRISIAYAACMCASGGPKTVRHCLRAGLQALLTQLHHKSTIADDTATAVYGVGAFFSSTRVALDKAEKKGVALFPHPLQDYTAPAMERMHHILLDKSSVMATKVAAVRTLESILVTSPATQFSTPEPVLQIVQLLVSALASEESDWKRACAQSLGLLLGQALDNDLDTCTLLQSGGPVQLYLTNQVLPQLVGDDNNKMDNNINAPEQSQILALASTGSLSAAIRIVVPLVNGVMAALSEQDFSMATARAQTLGSLFQKTGSYAPRAFQQMSDPVAVRRALAASATEHYQRDKDAKVFTAERVRSASARALSVAGLLQAAYRHSPESEHLDEVVASCRQFLPPRTVADSIRCSIELCFLATALRNSTNLRIGKESLPRLAGMQTDLLDFALDSRHVGEARSFAADCLYCVALTCSPISGACSIRALIAEKVMTQIFEHVAALKEHDLQLLESLTDCFSMIGLLAGAAAQRGGCSAKTADQAVRFLVDLACTGASVESFGGRANENKLDLNFLPIAPSAASLVSIHAASSIGTMLSSESGRRLWKQRVTHIAANQIQLNQENSSEPSDGMIATVCQLVCGGNILGMPTADLELFTQVVLGGLAPRSSRPNLEKHSATLSKLLLVSLIKLLSIAPVTLKDCAYSVVTGSMRAYAAADKFEPGDGLACKLLALQALESVTHIAGALHVIKDSKEPVVSILGAAMNHPSSLLRQAAVEVRNAWLLVE